MIDVKAFRMVNNLRQTEVADYLGVSKAFISQIEKGKSALPSEKYSRILNNTKGWDTSMFNTKNEQTDTRQAISENDVRKRIKLALKDKRLTENSVADGDSSVQSRLNSQLSHGKRITLDTILRILDACFDVSAEWLLRGNGEMLLKPATDDNKNNTIPEQFVRDVLAEKDKQIQTLLALLEEKQINR